jgi:chromosome segregation ATPase
MQALLLIPLLSGCTNIKNDSDRTRTEGAVTGAAAGAALGAGAGALLKKGKPGAIAAGAAAGAAAGGLAGAAYGNSVAIKKEGYAEQESALDAQLAGLRNQITNRQALNEKLRASVAEKEQKLQTVLASDRSAGPTVEEFDLRTSINAQLGRLDREARSWQETIDAHKTVLNKAGSDPRSGELQVQIDKLAEQRAELLRQRERLSAITAKLNQR